MTKNEIFETGDIVKLLYLPTIKYIYIDFFDTICIILN